nr:choice-of-anchor J domain-containing protein [Bacteroidota bacterium]
MIKPISAKNIVICALAFLAISSCKKTTSVSETPAVADQSFVEEFDTTAAAVSRGWQLVNSSDPKGTGVWMDGGSTPPFFKAYSNKGRNAGFIGADYTSTSADAATISNWLISPTLIMQNGDKIIFYTRSYNQYDGVSDSTDFGNSLQVRMNPTNDQVYVGIGKDVGNFTQGLLEINPKLAWS